MIKFSLLNNTKYSFLKSINPYLFITPAVLILLLLLVFPIIKVFQFSLYNNCIIIDKPEWVGLKHFYDLLSDTIFFKAFTNTVIFTFFSVIFHLILGFIFALLLNQPINNKALAYFRIILILPWIFTATIVAINWRLLLDPMGIINYLLNQLGIINSYLEWFGSYSLALPALILVNIWRGYPFIMVSLLAGLQGIQSNLYEAAEVDGANEWQKIIYITIPQLKPIILSVGVLDTIWTFRLFPLIWLTTGGGPGNSTEMLSTYTYKLAFEQFKFSKASALAVVILVVVTSLSYFYVKQQKQLE